MAFLLGCNYWASNAGADMWRFFDEDVVREDLKTLSSFGVSCMRVFPNWRDFQPVTPLYGGCGELVRYALEGDKAPTNPYYLDEEMLSRFDTFLDICDEYNIKVVVGLITGWMSGRLYIPSALFGKNVITDNTAIYFEELFIRGFVSRFKGRDAIYAWDLGNECNCMGAATKDEAVMWSATIANAIRATDSTRDIVSGMHGLTVGGGSWQIQDQAMWCDILTTHPYPYWGEGTRIDEILSLRTTMHATAQNKFYAECGGKPCLAEEIGTMGPMLASNKTSADFLRLNLFSLWSNDGAGVMWWCAHEQTNLEAFPYSDNMVEVELGLLNPDRSPKPVINEIKKFDSFLSGLDFTLPKANTDAVCLLTHGSNQWGVCYASHILSRKAGLNLKFAYADDGIPEAKTYLLPSVNGILVMDRARYMELRSRVYSGATLYISMDNGVLSEFEALTGVRIIDSYQYPSEAKFSFDGREYSIKRARTNRLESVGASVLASDDSGNPVMTEYKYGEGRVVFLNAPLESSLFSEHNAFDDDKFELYRYIFARELEAQPIKICGEGVYTTLHYDADTVYAVAVNHTGNFAEISVESERYVPTRVIYGDIKGVLPYDALVLEFKRNK